MALRGCFSCLKFLVFIVNFLFWLLGLGVVAVSLWLLFDQHLYLQTVADQRNDYFIGTYIILGVGALMTLVGFLGCCGAWKESPWMLGTFFVFLVIIFLGEVAAVLLIYFQQASYNELIEKSVRHTVKEKYHSNSSATVATFDLIQEGLNCCGANGPKDWEDSLYNGKNLNPKEIGVGTRKTKSFMIPESCCKLPDTGESACQNPITGGVIPAGVNEKGCAGELKNFFQEHIIYLLAAGVGIVVLEILGMFFSMCLCCALKRIEDLKA